MELAEDIKILPLAENWTQDADLLINSGVDNIDPGKSGPPAGPGADYGISVYLPKSDWRELQTGEHKKLIGITANSDLHNTVLIVDAPSRLRKVYQDLDLIRMRLSPREHQAGKQEALPFLVADACEWLTQEIFLPFDLCSAEINFTPPGRASTTYDTDRRRDRGLHIDNWGLPRRRPADRHGSGIRVCINLGEEDRNLVFINLSLSTILRLYQSLADPLVFEAAVSSHNASQLLAGFLGAFPYYPVIQVRLRPAQAYIAPVQNIPHDGSMTGKSKLDINLQLSSNRFVFTSAWQDRCHMRAAQRGCLSHRSEESRSVKLITDQGPPAMGPLRLLIIQPTPFCNINCDYCYLPNRNSAKKITLSTIARIFERVFESGLVEDGFTVVWHAGEPLVMGLEFYERAWELISGQSRGVCSISHSLQTNGILINDEWCTFLKNTQFRTGLSIDGPDFIHDARRKTRRGRGTHERVMRAVELLKRHEIPFTVIAVITAAALGNADEFVDFFIQNRILDIGFNIEEIEGSNTTSTLQSRESEYRRFIERVYERSKNHPELKIREFVTAERFLLHSTGVRSSQATPFQQLNVDVDGNYSTFSPELLGQSSREYGNFIIGNVHTTSISEAVGGPVFQQMYRDICAGVNLCRRNCEYFAVCGGGAPSNKYFENGTFISDETLDCRLMKKCISEVVLNGLRDSNSN